jgi:hypothetical protein
LNDPVVRESLENPWPSVVPIATRGANDVMPVAT